MLSGQSWNERHELREVRWGETQKPDQEEHVGHGSGGGVDSP